MLYHERRAVMLPPKMPLWHADYFKIQLLKKASVLSYMGENKNSLVHTSFALILKYCDKRHYEPFFL